MLQGKADWKSLRLSEVQVYLGETDILKEFRNLSSLTNATFGPRLAPFDVAHFGVLRLVGAFNFHTDETKGTANKARKS